MMNIILAFVILLGVTAATGSTAPSSTVSRVQECIVAANATDQTAPASRRRRPRSPGSRPGDRIVAFNGVAGLAPGTRCQS